MIAGHGIDLVDIDRLRRVLAKYGQRFIKRYYHSSEIERSVRYRDPVPYLAGRFAAKEAFSKAMGTGLTGFGMKDVIVKGEANEPPRIEFSEKLKELFPHAVEENLTLSISHEKGMAVASVIWFKNG